MAYTNSSLVTYKKLSPNHSGQRNHSIDTVTIHCIVGQWTAKQGCDFFANSKVEASANYIVGKDGSIGLCVEEKNRSWCSSNALNDNRAVTIEVASDTKHPYTVTDAALKALIKLLADICKRNGIKKLLWKGNPALIGQVGVQNMTVHRWFANKACPGDYLYSKHSYIANEVNKLLGAVAKPTPKPATKEIYRVGTGWKNGKCLNQKGAFEILANAKALCNKYAGYGVFNSKGVKVYTSTKKAVTSEIKAGLKLSFKGVPLYGSSTDKTKDGTLTGTYYLYDAKKINNRYRVTNSKANVGKAGQVTGWVDATYVK